MVQERHGTLDGRTRLAGQMLRVKLNARNLPWLVAKKRGLISFDPPKNEEQKVG